MNDDERTLRCAHCGFEFGASESPFVEVLGPSTALYQCPSCGRNERSLPPTDRGDDRDQNHTRRRFLRRIGAGAVTAVSIGALAGTAGATHDSDETCEGPTGVETPNCISDLRHAARQPARAASIDDPPITYAGIKDVRDDALCLTLPAGCAVWSVASLATPVPGDEVLVVGSCFVAWGACTARQVLIGLHGRQSEWSIYRVVREHGTENESRRVNRGDYLVLPGGD